MRVIPLFVAKQRNRPYETPENIRSDLATDQIKAFCENPCRGIARRGHRDKTRSLHRARPQGPRPCLSANRREHPELRRSECARVNLLNLSTTEPTL